MAGIQNNRYYNDPALGQAFSNLSGLFGPPSASDTLAYASAKAKKEEAGRLAEMFNLAKDPNVQQAVFDRLGQATGQWTPSTGYYGVDSTAATARRGQDLDDATKRYGVDRVFDASRLNNADDNTRALATNTADNARAFANARYGALGANQVLPDLPQSVADLYGVPAAVGQTGIITLNPGEQATLPDGRVMNGAVKPLTESEVKGGFLQQLPAEDQRSVALSGVPVEQIIMGDGKVVNQPRDRTYGAQPFINKGAEAKPVNYQTPDGRRGTAAVGGKGQLIDTQTGQDLPAGTVTFGANIQGSEADTGLATKTNLTAAQSLEASLDAAEFTTNRMLDILKTSPNVAGIPGRVKGVAQSLISSAGQVSKAYAEQAPDAVITLDEAKAVLENSLNSGGYDPNIVRVASGIYDLAYARAQLANPTGEVSRQAFDRSLESFGQSFLSSQEDLSTALRAFAADTIAAGRVKVNSLRGQRTLNGPSATADTSGMIPTSTTTEKQPDAGVEKWDFVNGKLQRVQ